LANRILIKKLKMKKVLSLILVFGFVYFSFGQEETQYKPVSYPAEYTSKLNVIYSQVGDWDGKMDLYLPPSESGPSPVMINIHGGGWNKGSKESQTSFTSWFKNGYAVANIGYRLVQIAPAPAAIEDVRSALIYLIRNAEELNIDVNKIVIMGGSAGGHLALMGGLLEDDPIFDNNRMGVKDVKVAAIINKYGITDVWDWGYGTLKTSRSATWWLGDRAKDEAFAKSVSPISYVKRTSPPIFIVHGDADPIVPYQQSDRLHEELNAVGVKNIYIKVPGGLHGKFPKEKQSEVNAQIMDFLKELNIHK
jgi:acetyl esterase/lipase